MQETAKIEKLEVSKGESGSSGGGCPMKRADGSYTFDWKALFQKHPHGKEGGKPLSKDTLTQASDGSIQVKQESGGGCPVKHSGNSNNNTSIAQESSSGCPVKHQQQQEYNVYSQPIDPTNQMPKVANQLPAPGQTEELSTNRVSSSIAKVS